MNGEIVDKSACGRGVRTRGRRVETHVDALRAHHKSQCARRMRRDESRRGAHECVRHAHPGCDKMLHMTSRRRFLGAAAAGGISAASPAFSARSANRYDEIETRVTRRDFKNLHKEDLPTPCMVVDLEIFEKNLRTMADHCRSSGIHLRGHVKVHKSPDIAKRQLAL